MRIILQTLLFIVQCSTPSLAFINNISITTNIANERVFQSTIYQDNTILLRLVNDPSSGSNCLENEINLKLIHPDGTIDDLTFNDDRILPENFCIPPISTTNSQFITPPPLNQQGDGNGTLPISSFEEGDVGGMMLDGIRVYALQPGLILLTYFCKLESPNVAKRCGMLATWDKKIKQETIDFEQTCTDSNVVIQNLIEGGEGGGEFLRACYLSDRLLVNWTRYAVDDEGKIELKNTGIITNVIKFSPNVTEIFPTKDGGYGIVTAQYLGIEDSLYLPPWTLFLHFIPPLEPDNNVNISSTSQIYMQPSERVRSLNIYKCGVSYQGYGYSCVMRFLRVRNNGIQDDVLIIIDFSDVGGVLNTTEFGIVGSVIDVESLYYGGYLMLIQYDANNVSGSIYDDDGTFFSGWGMPSTTNEGFPLTYIGNFGVFTNNTIWCVANSDDGVKFITNDLLVNYSTSLNNASTLHYGNSFVNFTDPKINDTIQRDRSTISITFMNSIKLSTGDISIWQNGDDQSKDVLRQFFSANQSTFVHLNDKTVSVDVFKSTFNIPGANYYVKVDNGFVKDLRYDQTLLGIREDRWSFKTELETEPTSNGLRSATVRLTPDGTKEYESSSEQKRSEFSRSLSEDLSRTIPCELSRLNISNDFQYNSRQIILLVIVNPGGLQGMDSSLSSDRVISDLDSLIKKKSFTGIIKGNFSRMLDDEYGMVVITNVWEKYHLILIGIGIGLLLLTILFCTARRQARKKEEKKKEERKIDEERNYGNYGNFAIFVFAIIAVDLGLDITFIICHGNDLKWLYLVSVIFLVIPILINVLFTYIIVARETRKEKNFLEWWGRNSKTALIFTLFSGIDVEALNIVSSECAGFNELSAPLADETIKRVLLVNGIVICLEDIPQLVVYILYQKWTIVPAMIPVLALSSCCIVLTIKLIGVIYFCIYPMYKSKPKLIINEGKYELYEPDEPEGPVDVRSEEPQIQGIYMTQNFETGAITCSFRKPEDMDVKIQTVGKKVKDSIVNVDDAGISPEEESVPGASSSLTTGYTSKMIERFDLEGLTPVKTQEEELSSQPSTSRIGLSRVFGGGSRGKKGKGSRDSKKGKRKDDDEEQEKED